MIKNRDIILSRKGSAKTKTILHFDMHTLSRRPVVEIRETDTNQEHGHKSQWTPVFLNTIVYFDVHTVNQRLIEEMGESFLLRDIGARLSLDISAELDFIVHFDVHTMNKRQLQEIGCV